jgi:hypothetical protein
MTDTNNLGYNVQQILKHGRVVNFKYYSVSGGSASYDDDVAYTLIGSLLTSGLIMPMTNSPNSSDYFQVQQGRALFDDSKLFVQGNIPTGSIFKIEVGSKVYAPIANGIEIYELNGTEVYKKIYCRVLPTGSLAIEV